MLAFRGIILVIFAILSAQPTSQIHLTRLSLLRVARAMDGSLQSRVKRQAITDPQPFPVMNAVLNIPIPTNIGHFPGAASTPIDKCDRDEILMEDGTCQNILTGGNCGPNEEILLDPDTNMGFCAPRLCPPDRVFVHATQLCHDPQETGICPPGRELYYSAYGTSVCSCPDGTIEGDDDLDDDVCELILGENLQCLAGQVFWFKDFNSPPECLPDPCKGANLNKKPTDLPFVPSKATGECFQLGQSEGVCPTGLFYTLAIDDLKGECESLEDAGYNIFSTDELEALKKIYGSTITANTGPPLPTEETNVTIGSNSSTRLVSAGVPLSTTGNEQPNNRINMEPTLGAASVDIQQGQSANGNIASQSEISAAASGVSAGNISITQIDSLPNQSLGASIIQNNKQSNLQPSIVSPIEGPASNKNAPSIEPGSLSFSNNAPGPSGQGENISQLDAKINSSNAASPELPASNKPSENVQTIAFGPSAQKQNSPSNIVDKSPISQIFSSNVNIIKNDDYLDSEVHKTFQNSQLHLTTSHSSSHTSNAQNPSNDNFNAIQNNKQNSNSLSNYPTQQTQLNNNVNHNNVNSISINKDRLNPNREQVELTGLTQANNPNAFISGASISHQHQHPNTELTSGPQILGVEGPNGNRANPNLLNIGNSHQQVSGGHQHQVTVQNNQVVSGQQRPSFVGNTNPQSNSVSSLAPSISNSFGSVGNAGQLNNNQQQNSFEIFSPQNSMAGANSVGSLGQSNSQQSLEIFGGQGTVNNQNSLGNFGQGNNQQQQSQEALGGFGQQNSPEFFGQNPAQNLQQSQEIFGRGMPNFGFRFRRQILNDPILSAAKEISIYNANDNSLTILSRRKRALYSYATPSNVFESRLLGCKPGAARDINAKCRKKILPAKVPKHRNTRAAPPVPPTPSCPSGQAFNLRRRCVAVSTAQQSLMAKNLG